MIIPGLGWLTFVVAPVAAMLLPHNLIIALSGEAVIILWLLVMGVHVPPPVCEAGHRWGNVLVRPTRPLKE